MQEPCSGILDYQIDTFDMQNSKEDNFKNEIFEALNSAEEPEDAMANLIQVFKAGNFKSEREARPTVIVILGATGADLVGVGSALTVIFRDFPFNDNEETAQWGNFSHETWDKWVRNETAW